MNPTFYMSKKFPALTRALIFAATAHADQVDKAGEPYILHPIRVSLETYRRGYRDPVMEIAMLHDTVEDCGVSVDDLIDVFGTMVGGSVWTLTHKNGESRDTYIRNIFNTTEFFSAQVVKLADMLDNTSPERMEWLTSDKRRKLVNKYSDDIQLIIKTVHFALGGFRRYPLKDMVKDVQKNLLVLKKKS